MRYSALRKVIAGGAFTVDEAVSQHLRSFVAGYDGRAAALVPGMENRLEAIIAIVAFSGLIWLMFGGLKRVSRWADSGRRKHSDLGSDRSFGETQAGRSRDD